MTSSFMWIFILLTITLLDQTMAASSNCYPPPSGMGVEEQAYNADIIVKAKITGSIGDNHTAVVTDTFQTKFGGLKKRAKITVGPLKVKGCTRIKKNSEYILFLEAESGDAVYRFKYNPVSKRETRKLKKVLCKNCFKSPKFKGKDKEKAFEQNEKFQFKCKATGTPKPMAVFLKNGKVLPKKENGIKITISKKGGGGRLKINSMKKSHEGKYTCRVTNFLGTAELSYTVLLQESSDDLDTSNCIECGPEHDGYCSHGRCCIVPVVNDTSCRCEPKYQGRRCDEKTVPLLPRNKINIIEARYHQQTIAIMGVCIALLLVFFICYVVYCRFKKSRSHIRKEIIARNGHAGVTVDSGHGRQIADADTAGILGDDPNSREDGIEMTGYRSTNLTTEPLQPPHNPYAITQYPQTYEDVILPAANENQSLINQQNSSGYASKHDEAQELFNRPDSRPQRTESDNRRRRKKGVAIGQSDHHTSNSDMENSGLPRRVNDLKSGQQSMSSSASSLASHDLKRAVIPLDERFIQNIVKRGMEVPPTYQSGLQDDVRDSHDQEPTTSGDMINAPEVHSASSQSDEAASVSSPTGLISRERIPSSLSSGSAHRVTTFDNDGKIEEEMLGRNDGALQGVTPHSPPLSPQNSTQRLPSQNIYPGHNTRTSSTTSHGSDRGGSHKMSPRMKQLPYQNRNVSGNVPYYEHNLDSHGSPTSPYHDNDDIFTAVETPDNFYSNESQRRNVPGSPRQYQTSPEMSMGIPYRHAPVTVASAHHHHLPLLTKEKPELIPVDPESKLLVGSTVSLSSSNSSVNTERNRDSHKIEV